METPGHPLGTDGPIAVDDQQGVAARRGVPRRVQRHQDEIGAPQREPLHGGCDRANRYERPLRRQI